MKAARLHEYGKGLVLDDVPKPEPGPGEVVIAVQGAGFCHSDVHVIDGELRGLPRLPLTLGHENAGVVAEIGRGVRSVREGDPVVVYGAWGDGLCDYCISGVEQLCVTPAWSGLSAHDGGYAEYLRVPHERHLVKLDRLAPCEAAILTDAALTPYRAVKRSLPYIQPDHPVLVIGVGGLGQFGIQILHLLAGAPILAVDTNPEKLAIARALGASEALDAREPDLLASVLQSSRGGVCAAFDFVGSDATLALALAATRTGGKVVQVGLGGGEARLRALRTVRFEVQFEATLWGSLKELREVVALAESERLRPFELEFAPLERIQDVYERLKRGEIRGRAVITP